ncbi:oxidoreductase, partial [bacterium]|nr:oxidoreductase [bacterium]
MSNHNTNKNEIKLIVLDPRHFHAALLQKNMYSQISPIVNVYADMEDNITEYLQTIKQFNNRKKNPTHWQTKIYTGDDYLQKTCEEKRGNLVILAGNNKKRIQYIKNAIDAGLNVLADKPLCIDKDDFKVMREIFNSAREKHLLLYDIMTERYEITNILQKTFCTQEELFGRLLPGTHDNPSITMESLHHFFKYIGGKPIKRPAWYFDISQTGEGIVDVTSHLIDLAHWSCFPEQLIDFNKDIKLLSATHQPTKINKQQFKQLTQFDEFPGFLKSHVKNDILSVYANGEINYTLKDHHIRVKIAWDFQAPDGKGDSHYSLIRGTKANIIIHQNETPFPELFIKVLERQNEKELETVLKNSL